MRDDAVLRRALPVLQAPLCLWTLWCCISVFFKIILTSLYLVQGLIWWDWPFTWWTDQLFSFSALTLLLGSSDPYKIVPDMTYNVFGGTLNPIQPTILGRHKTVMSKSKQYAVRGELS